MADDPFPSWALFEHGIVIRQLVREGWQIESRRMEEGLVVAILGRDGGLWARIRGLRTGRRPYRHVAVTGNRYGDVFVERLPDDRLEYGAGTQQPDDDHLP